MSAKPKSNLKRGRMPAAEQDALRRRVRALLDEHPELSAPEAYERLQPACGLTQFVAKYFPSLADRRGQIRFRSQVPVIAMHTTTNAVPAPKIASAPVTPLPTAAPVSPEEILYRSPEGSFRATRGGRPGRWVVQMEVTVDRSTMLQLQGQACALLYPEGR